MISQSPSLTRKLYIAALLLIMVACSREIPSDPSCRLANDQTPAPPSAAACLIKSGDALLMLTLSGSQTLQLPNGPEKMGQSAQCTAHQATWKMTGLNVEVGKLLFLTNQVAYYDCNAQSSFPLGMRALPVPEWAKHSVEDINWVNLFRAKQEDLSPTLDLIQLREGFTELSSKKSLPLSSNPQID
jgi:hypothetical protein